MSNPRQNPVELFQDPLQVAALLIKQGATEPFEKGARFNLVGGNGERHQFVHSAETLRDARDTLQALSQVRGGVEVEQAQVAQVHNARQPQAQHIS